MSTSKRQLEERQEQDFNKEIASILCISYEELLELDFQIESDSDASYVLISFPECPANIRSKIEKHHKIKYDPAPFFGQYCYSVLIYDPFF